MEVMKSIKNNWLGQTLLILALAIGTVACKEESKDNNQNTEQASATILEVDELLADPDSYVGDTIQLQGVCTHICAHGGGKIFLMGSDDTKSIRVEAGDAISSFSQETVNSLVQVEGVLVEERIDEAFLAKWEAEVAAQTDEKHGEEGGSGCAADQKANNEEMTNSVAERIAQFRSRIAERTEKEGKPYVSLYYVQADKYQIQ